MAQINSSSRAFAILLACCALWSCKPNPKHPQSGDTGGTVVITTASDADFLFPPLVTTSQGRTVTELVFEHLVNVGDSLNVLGDEGFIPKLAQRWEWSDDSLSIAFSLNPDAHFHDGRPVRAHDVQFTFALYTDSTLASPLASLYDIIDSVAIRDSLTPVIWLKRRSPLAFYEAASQMLILPQHVYGSVPAASLRTSDLIRTPVGSGPFRFVRWVPGATIELAADTAHYRPRANLNRLIWTISPDIPAAATKLITGEADFFEAMRPEHVAQAAQTSTIKVAMYPGFDVGLMIFNLHAGARPHPLFGDRELRRALTMAIDRTAIVANTFDSLAYPSIGPMLRAMPTTDTTIAHIPYDTARAAQMLDALGWRRNARGIRERNGKPLAFSILIPSGNRNRERCAVLIQAQLKQIGVDVTIQAFEYNTFLQRANTRKFDALIQSWHLDASPATVKQIWSSEAAEPHGNNFGGYMSTQFDAQLDSALRMATLRDARPLFKRAYQTIVDDAPAVWLYELKSVAGYHHRLRIPTIRADAWWAHLDRWWIPSEERIARDQLPATTP